MQNTIDLAHALGIATPRVALLAAMDGVTAALPVDRRRRRAGEDGGAGPDQRRASSTVRSRPDSALSADAARVNGVDDPVAGHADVLIAPGMEAGAHAAAHADWRICGALAAGIVLGARVPIVLAGAQRFDRSAHGLLRAGVADRRRARRSSAAAPRRRRAGAGRRLTRPTARPRCASLRAPLHDGGRAALLHRGAAAAPSSPMPPLALRLFPFLAWRHRVTRETLRADLVAGLLGA